MQVVESAPPVRNEPSRAELRADIQGLRALAVLLVLGFHIWGQWIPGGFIGVDVFFVISGFLITSHLMRRPPRSGRHLAEFWARRIRRLMPAALLALAGTLVASRLLAPETQWLNTAHEAIAATLYVENWKLAFDSVDYLAASNAPSPVQQFWSLSVEEQFYIVWPVLILLIVILATRIRIPVRPAVFAGLTLIVLASFVYSLRISFSEPGWAYFVTPTRVWELGVGAVLAVGLTIRSDRDPSAVVSRKGSGAAGLAWLGTMTVLVSAFVIDADTPFPGWAALFPVLGTALIIAARSSASGLSPSRLLAWRPVAAIGDASYSIYLWHWPIIILLLPAIDPTPTQWSRSGALVLSILVGFASKRYVEDVFRFGRGVSGLSSTFGLAAIGMTVVIGIALLQISEVRGMHSTAAPVIENALDDVDPCFGAAALAAPDGACVPVSYQDLVPTPVDAAVDWPDVYWDDCWEWPPFPGLKHCEYGRPDGAVSVALLGNSHAGHWLPALQELADPLDLRITTFLASECTTNEQPVQFDAQLKADGCLNWAEAARSEVLAGDFDIVVISNRNVHPAVGADSEQESMTLLAQGYRDYLEPFANAGVPVVVIRDTPFPGTSIPDCLASNRRDMDQCSGRRAQWVPFDPVVPAVTELGGSVQVADLNDSLCREDECFGTEGGVVVYFDDSHMTATYAKTLAPELDRVLVERGILP